MASISSFTLASDTATLTVNKATALEVTPAIEGTNVTLTDTSAIRILNTTGTPTNQYGIYIEDLTAGGTDYAFYNAGAATNYLGTGITFIFFRTGSWAPFILPLASFISRTV